MSTSTSAVKDQSRFLDLNRLAALQHMRFTTRHRIEGTYSGRHTSRSLGGSGEFADYREYTPGEDLRRLDWRVSADWAGLYQTISRRNQSRLYAGARW